MGKSENDAIKGIHDALQKKKHELASLNGNLEGALRDLNRLQDKFVENSDTKAKVYVEDAATFGTITDISKIAAQRLTATQTVTASELIAALRSRFVHTSDPQRDGEQDPCAMQWSELGTAEAKAFRCAPGATCMFGPLDARPRERRQAVRRPKQALAELSRPDELEAINEQDKQETDRNMEEMWNIVSAQGPGGCAVAELCCNHDSFSQTVENLFTLSFLVRDNRVAMFADPARGLSVRAQHDRKKGDRQGGGDKAMDARQFVMAVHMDDWEVMKRIVRRQDCLMPHRAVVDHDGAPGPSEAPAAKRRKSG